MATSDQVAHDLQLQAKALHKRRLGFAAASCERAATVILQQATLIAELEAAAEAEAKKHNDYFFSEGSYLG